MEDGILRRRTPKPSLAISKTATMSAIGVVGIVLAIAIVAGKRSPEVKATASGGGKALPGQAVAMLPSTYADLPPLLKPTRPAVSITARSSNTELEKLLAHLEAEKRRRQIEAHRASVSFQGLSVGKPENSGENGERNSKNSETRPAGKVHLSQTVVPPRSEYELMAGTLIPGLLLTGLNSDLPGQILGQVSQNVYDTVAGRYLLVPQGTRVLGQYDSRIAYGQERVLIVWTRLIFPNGDSLSLEDMPGVDLSGYAGLADQVNNHYRKLLTGVVFSSLLGAAAQIAQGPDYRTVNPSYGDLAVQGIARNANEAGQEITRRNLSIPPTIEIRPGYRFSLFVHRDLTLEPYPS